MRTGPRHPRLGRAAFRLTLPLLEGFCARRGIFRANSAFAADRFKALRGKLDSGETLYLGGICASGTHNSGIALIEVTCERGPKLICNNEEERFSGERHTTKFPDQSIDELVAMLRRSGLGPERLRRSKDMDAVVMIAEEGAAYAMWQKGQGEDGGKRFTRWFGEWRADDGRQRTEDGSQS